MRLSVYLPEELHRVIMHRCVDENVAFTKLAERLLREYLKTPLKKGGK
ncbi:MAG: CopG family transcriptional regulator [candidate division NC10 bacterium]|nr:CopG family transcriptional regulator [candidate division NC10 bacterium]